MELSDYFFKDRKDLKNLDHLFQKRMLMYIKFLPWYIIIKRLNVVGTDERLADSAFLFHTWSDDRIVKKGENNGML